MRIVDSNRIRKPEGKSSVATGEQRKLSIVLTVLVKVEICISKYEMVLTSVIGRTVKLGYNKQLGTGHFRSL